MTRIIFTPNLRKHLDSSSLEVSAEAARPLADVLEEVFSMRPQLRSYLLDDQGALRRHVNIFIDNTPVHDRITLTDQVENDDEIYIMQALSGG